MSPRSGPCWTRSAASWVSSTPTRLRSSRRWRTPTGSPAELKKQDATIKSALDNIPATLKSVNRQRADLVKLLKALDRLSGVGVRVIKASKESTINSLRSLAPVLDGFAKAGENFPKAFQVFLTYPFVDEAVGRDPQVARNLHMGDYTNLSVNLDLNLDTLGDLLGVVCGTLETVKATLQARAEEAADQIIAPLTAAGTPKAVTDVVRRRPGDADRGPVHCRGDQAVQGAGSRRPPSPTVRRSSAPSWAVSPDACRTCWSRSPASAVS